MQIINIYKNSSGVLKAKIRGEEVEHPIKPIKCFPITDAERYLGLFKIGMDGKTKEEIAFISDHKLLDEDSRKLIGEELNNICPLTWIKKIYSIKQANRRLKWQVDTNKGQLTFEVKAQKDIYMIQGIIAVIHDAEGKRFLVNPENLDPKSQTLLEVYI
jgi:hypothetical protein